MREKVGDHQKNRWEEVHKDIIGLTTMKQYLPFVESSIFFVSYDKALLLFFSNELTTVSESGTVFLWKVVAGPTSVIVS